MGFHKFGDTADVLLIFDELKLKGHFVPSQMSING